mgnify:FL=1
MGEFFSSFYVSPKESSLGVFVPRHITEYRLAKDLFTRGRDIILSSDALEMKQFTQHGTTSVFEHCVSVAKFSLLFSYFLEKTIHLKVDRDSLVRGALLHDYFLYDWHDRTPELRIHSFTHPGIALHNADRDFELNDIERDIIGKHMFPLTVVPPRYRESVIVCLADKWCALCETFRIDVSSYLIYRVNYRIVLANGELRIIHGNGDTAVENI